jgi:hypothetical protein
MFVLDFNKLVSNVGGVVTQLTLSNIAGDTSVTYEQGLQTNTWKEALIYEDDAGQMNQTAVFNGYGTDANAGGKIFTMEKSLLTGYNIVYTATGFSVPGKEVHKYDVDPGQSFIWNPQPNAINPVTGNVLTDTTIRTLIAGVLDPAAAAYNPAVPATVAAYANALSLTLGSSLVQYLPDFIGIGNKKLTAYNLQTIMNNYMGVAGSNAARNTHANVVAYEFCNNENPIVGPGSKGPNTNGVPSGGFNNSGTQMYGSIVLSGTNTGMIQAFDLNTGFPVNQSVPRTATGFVDPQGVTPVMNSSIGIYNPEGQRVAPLIVDGVMYGWGGANRWAQFNLPPASKLFMWTPYGK